MSVVRSIGLQWRDADEPKGRPLWHWIALITLLWHLLLFWVLPRFEASLAPPRVEIKDISPAELDAIKKQWKNRERSLLLNKDSTPPKEAPTPKDAKYNSDRNRTVEREQQAAQGDVLPRAGHTAQLPKSQTQGKNQSQADAPLLGNLGVPLNLDRVAPALEQFDTEPSRPGADQALLDKNLPIGAENMLNTVEFKYYSFYARLHEAIAPIWSTRIREILNSKESWPLGDHITYVEAVLTPDGSLVDAVVVQRSGINEFDSGAVYPWKKLARFPNPPKELLKPDGYFHVGYGFLVRLENGAPFQVDAQRSY